MGFLGVYTAVYDYHPQAEGELEIREGDLLYVLEKSSEDDWWKAKKKAEREDEDEPEGLVPNNYVEEAQPVHKARALYDYTRQTDEEVSFSEDAELAVYDISDPDWTLVGSGADFGFAPSNYIEIVEGAATDAAESPIPSPVPALPERPRAVPVLQQQQQQQEEEEEDVEEAAEDEYEQSKPASPVREAAQRNPAAAAIANILHRSHPEPSQDVALPPRPVVQHVSYEPEDDYDSPRSPPLPQRPSSQFSPPPRDPSPPEPSPPPRASFPDSSPGVRASPPDNRVGEPSPRSPAGYHLYNINEMVEAMGKRKKMPTTLGINIATGTIFISPEGDERQQEWTADRLSHYSIEGKHVFLDLVRPSKSVDFHAGAKDTAKEIVAALGEIAGSYRAEGLREVLAAGKGGAGHKTGQVLYDFMAQGDDEVTVAVGDEVVIIDDTKSEEWWMVRRMMNGKEGVVPSSYIEITGFLSTQPSGLDSGLSSVRKNQLEEERLTKEATHKSKHDSMDSRDSSQVGPIQKLPERRSSLMAQVGNNTPKQHRHRKNDSKSNNKTKPDSSKTRQWTDRTKSFTVEAQFIGLQDGKIHLHKVNGVKIAVPIEKMSVEDLEYVEKMTGVSLDEDKPLSDIRRRSLQDPSKLKSRQSGQAGASIEQPKPPEYDWFDFFLKAGVGPHQCERYAQNFIKDWMDESVLPDITPETLRTLGLKEGDILRVMRYLDSMYNRTGAKSKLRNVSFGGEEVIGNGEEGGLFSGPGGALRNNTRKGRPAPNTPASDTVDAKAFDDKKDTASKPEQETSPPASAASEKPVERGFDDDAWEVKKPKQSVPPATQAAAAAPTPSPPPPAASPATTQPLPPTGAMADLSLLQTPLQPTPAQPTPVTQPAPAPALPVLQPQLTAIPAPQPQPQIQQPQQTGATPGFFAQVGQASQPLQTLAPQSTGFQPTRQRPLPPMQTIGQNSLLPPPPQRPLSAPQNFVQQSPFAPPPLQPQLTGIPHTMPQLAAPGQSLGELNQQRFQPMIQPQPTGFMGQNQFQNGVMPQITGYGQQPAFQSLAPQPTGFVPSYQQPMQTGINSVLPPALQPQPTGVNGMHSSPFTSISPPPVPPIPQQPTAAPLQPQKTGPAPPVRFGVKNEPPKKLAPQPTGLRANLAQATPTNPFGF
ncbi:hypothetical protein ASPZODRAFT_133286 [Penicilliopsis zonata CBS 506.65]|uniref:Actin cytoskeleton-regulatory complex protein SLA1 n=1 Tax=Penicilliopsis zonata CBS 506.65 TaxID=1073090 RepID=A0A1L9SGP1_9EURO|nr:hypothetical protein ASPZODRAFT_133286 [Penicilliopsis zonata CBS 506.65]OJJ46257.1 hypothetical protein ASPZODRAFT_133286 [Penicilliopsis zonata CBS 506.65]